MRGWQLLLIGYLATAPLPVLFLEAAHIRLYYEEIGWWLVGLYSLPMIALAAYLELGSLVTASLLYWLVLMFAWLLLR